MFVDVHSHVVPSGDDGVGSTDEGVELCREAARRGTSVLFATPHVWPHLRLTPPRTAAIREAHAEMSATLRQEGLDLRLGFELSPSPELLDEDLTRYRLGDLPAALMELPFAGPLGLAERIAEEMEMAGITPVLGHPERADRVTDDPDVVAGYAERGWLLQINATSLLGRHGPERQERVGSSSSAATRTWSPRTGTGRRGLRSSTTPTQPCGSGSASARTRSSTEARSRGYRLVAAPISRSDASRPSDSTSI